MMSDHELSVRFQVANILAQYGDEDERVFTEFGERFGRDAMENLARWCTGVHASSEDMLVLAACHFERYQQIMKGEWE